MLSQVENAERSLQYLKSHLGFEDEIVTKDVKMYLAHARNALDKVERLLNTENEEDR